MDTNLYPTAFCTREAADYGLQIGLVWWIPGMALATAYFFYVYRRFSSKVTLKEEGY